MAKAGDVIVNGEERILFRQTAVKTNHRPFTCLHHLYAPAKVKLHQEPSRKRWCVSFIQASSTTSNPAARACSAASA
jgi:hypothetical protein